MRTQRGYDATEVGVGFTLGVSDAVSLYSEVSHVFSPGSNNASSLSKGLAGSIGIRVNVNGKSQVASTASSRRAVALPPLPVVPPSSASSTASNVPLHPMTLPPERVMLSADALFDFDSAQLRPAGRSSLDALARMLNDMQYNEVDVSGHTDRLGSDTHNQALSERRANAVRDYLITRGVPASKISTAGFGRQRPLTTPAQCADERNAKLIACLQPDRRVEGRVEVEISSSPRP
jgi:OOP family OmpA-OmpF porin